MSRSQGGRTRSRQGSRPRERTRVERPSTSWQDLQHACITRMERSSTRMERASTCMDRSPKSRSITIATDDLRTVYNHSQPSFEHECLHEPRLENMTALADDLMSSKPTLLPASGPHLGSERHANSNARTPCVKTVSTPSRQPPVRLMMKRLLMSTKVNNEDG